MNEFGGRSEAEFNQELDKHLEQEAERAAERARRGDVLARRPEADPMITKFGDLQVGDYMTAEEGPDARWVEVLELGAFQPRTPGNVVVSFRTAQPLGVGMHDRWVIERPPDELVVIDNTARKEHHAPIAP